MSWISGRLNLLEPSGPRRACYGTAPFPTELCLVLTEGGVKLTIFWSVTPCGLVGTYQRLLGNLLPQQLAWNKAEGRRCMWQFFFPPKPLYLFRDIPGSHRWEVALRSTHTWPWRWKVVGGQLHAPAPSSREREEVTVVQEVVGAKSCSGRARKISSTMGFEPLTVQPITCCHTDYVFLLPKLGICQSAVSKVGGQ